MRRQDVPAVASQTAPDAPSPPSTLVQRRDQKAAVHFHAHARHRLSSSATSHRGSSPTSPCSPHVRGLVSSLCSKLSDDLRFPVRILTTETLSSQRLLKIIYQSPDSLLENRHIE